MRHALLALALVSGCTRHNVNNTGMVCTPGEQRACACLGGATGVQVCNPMGSALGECLGCPGGPSFDLSGADDLSVAGDLSTPHDLVNFDPFDFPPGTDLTGFNPLADMSVPPDDLAMSLPDLAELPDLAGADLRPITPCPIVMLVLDTSGSMSIDFPPPPSPAPTHIAGAQGALNRLVDSYGSRLRFGFSHYDSGSGVCSDGTVTNVEPGGTVAAVKAAINATVAGGTTNTGNAIDFIAADTKMHSAIRQSYVVLVTDGAPNCEATDPGFAVGEIDAVAKAAQPIKTYVIALDVAAMFSSDDETQMELMANAGQRPCASGFCDGHAYYPAPDVPHLDKALDLVLNDIASTVPGCGNFGCFPSGAACSAGTTCCGTVGCKNLLTDSENCGQCGTACGAGTCAGGHCQCGGVTCPDNDKCCGAACCSSLDMLQPSPAPCVCNTACSFGCVATNCCGEDGFCSATPNLCSCSGFCL